MRKWLWTPMLLTASMAAAEPINLSFDNGDTAGWTVSVEEGMSGLRTGGLVAAGELSVASDLMTIHAIDGDYLAAITAGSYFRPSATVFDISLSQTFEVTQGDLISGWSLFFNGDHERQDSGWVRLLAPDQTLVAIAWLEESGGSD